MPFIEHTDKDQNLIYQYKETGSVEVLGALFSPYMDMVYGVCLKYLENKEDAQDAVINIFEELIEKVKKHDIANFRPWLYQVAKNHCLMKLRAQKKYNVVTFDVETMQLSQNVHHDNEYWDKESQLVKLENCIKKLQGDQLKIVSLFYMEGKSYHEIVEVTRMEWGAVKSAIQNGRRNLKICMEQSNE